MRHRTDAAQPSQDLGTLGFLIEGQREDRRLFRLGVATAVVLHLAAFVVTWPTIAGPPPAPPAEQPVRVVVLQVFEPPERLEVELPKPPQAEKVPIPDPTPDDPEPFIERGDEREVPEIATDAFGPVIALDPPPDPVPEVVQVGVDIQPPERTYMVQPVYPTGALRAGIGGAVILELTIDREGKVADVQVLRGLPLGLTESAVEAARQWRFEPSRLNGRPVSVIYRLTVTFTPHRA